MDAPVAAAFYNGLNFGVYEILKAQWVMHRAGGNVKALMPVVTNLVLGAVGGAITTFGSIPIKVPPRKIRHRYTARAPAWIGVAAFRPQPWVLESTVHGSSTVQASSHIHRATVSYREGRPFATGRGYAAAGSDRKQRLER